MKKFIMAVALSTLSLPAIAEVPMGLMCCTCDMDTYCTCNEGGIATYYTDTDTCPNSLTPTSGSYKPCNSFAVTDPWKKCALGGGGVTPILPGRECAENKYGKSGSLCQDCPDNGKSPKGTEVITGCYQPKDVNHTDTAGTWIYTNDCYYSN